jgi:hypothetical protein
MRQISCQPDESVNESLIRAEFGLPVYFRVAKTGGNQPIDSFRLRGLVGVACIGCYHDELRLKYGKLGESFPHGIC